MLKLTIGDKIKSLTKKSIHVVESIEVFENQTVVFTEDVMCFPIEDVQKNYDSFVAEFFTKVFSGVKPTPEEEKKLQRIFKEKNIVSLQK
jgi:hypothetical protein